MNRRILLASIGGLLAGFNVRKVQSANRERDPIFQHDLPDLRLHDWSVTTVEVDYAPGESSNAHRHPGLTFAYVLEGEITSKVDDEAEKTYATGEMWMETPGQLRRRRQLVAPSLVLRFDRLSAPRLRFVRSARC